MSRLGLVAIAVAALLAYVPMAGAATPVSGTVTTCSSTVACGFYFNTTAGTGWANATAHNLSFRLPGEAKASYNLSYSTYIEKLTGTYTYWTVGTFVGTDVNSGHVVFGTTNTNYTITAHCTRGCSYTYTTDNGTIVFHFTRAQATSTAVSCAPASVHPGQKTTCTVTVTNLWNASNVPLGKVRFSAARLGKFAPAPSCNLTAGSCSVTFRPYDNTVGTVTILATYVGSSSYYTSFGSDPLSVSGGGG